MNGMKLRFSVSVLVITGLLFSVAGCDSGSWKDPDYVSQRLKEGSPATQSMAIDKLRNLPEDKQKKVAGALADVYLQGNMNQDDAMQLLVQYRAKAAKDAYLEEIKNNNSGYVGAAAEALGEAGVKEAVPEMLKVYKQSDDDDMKVGILRGLQHMPSKQMAGPLIETLKLDVDNHRIALHSYSCEILGAILQDNKGVLKEKGRRTLVRAMYLGNKAGQTVSKECGLAVQQLGQPAVPILIETFKGENKDVNQLLMTYNTGPDYKFPRNHAKLLAAQRLGTMRAEEAVEPFIEDLESTKVAPDPLSGQHAVSWRVKEGAATSSVIRGLGDIGNEQATDILREILLGEVTTDEWDDITDGLVELQLRQDAAMGLVGTGNRDVLDSLMEMAEEGVIIDLERRAKMLEDKWNSMSDKEKEKNPNIKPMPIEQRYQFNWMSAEAYAHLATTDDLEPLEQLASESEHEELKKKYKNFAKAVESGGKCLDKNKASAKGKCLAKLLDHDKAVVQEKAAWELGRLEDEVGSKHLVKNLDTDDLKLREVLTNSLYSAPSGKAVDKINKILEAEADKSGNKYEKDHYRLKMLRAWLKNNVDE
jgi:HEAT repeat protein